MFAWSINYILLAWANILSSANVYFSQWRSCNRFQYHVIKAVLRNSHGNGRLFFSITSRNIYLPISSLLLTFLLWCHTDGWLVPISPGVPRADWLELCPTPSLRLPFVPWQLSLDIWTNWENNITSNMIFIYIRYHEMFHDNQYIEYCTNICYDIMNVILRITIILNFNDEVFIL